MPILILVSEFNWHPRKWQKLVIFLQGGKVSAALGGEYEYVRKLVIIGINPSGFSGLQVVCISYVCEV